MAPVRSLSAFAHLRLIAKFLSSQLHPNLFLSQLRNAKNGTTEASNQGLLRLRRMP